MLSGTQKSRDAGEQWIAIAGGFGPPDPLNGGQRRGCLFITES